MVLDTIQDSFENASNEGVDLPTLYDRSRSINLEDEMSKIPVLEGSETPQTIAVYNKIRFENLQEFAADDQIGSLSQIYQASEPEQFDIIKAKYESNLKTMQNTIVPKSYIRLHRAYLLTFQKIVELIDFRKQALIADKLEDAETREKGLQKATESVWGFRILSEENAQRSQ